MKWLKAKYTYILIVLSLLVSTGLQIVWLQQLFDAQQKQLKDEIENLVSRTAQTNLYYSLSTFSDPGNLKLAKQLFLSPQWQQLRLAFDNMKIQGMRASTSIIVDNDSTAVTLSLNLKNSFSNKRRRPIVSSTGKSPEELRLSDSLSLVKMKKNLNASLKKMGINSKSYYNIYYYNAKKAVKSDVPKGFKPVFISSSYLYNIQDIYRCQLNLGSINSVVWYRMRYYLASSILMILLTCTAFYFILKLLRSQQLYAAAKSDFTSNMTHELKTPIATVLVAMESIKKYKLINNPETLQSYLDITQHEMRRLDLMVEKALNISSGTETGQPLNLELYDVQSGLQQVVSSMQLQNSDANIQFNLLEEPCFVYGDPVHLTNIFYNLIDNAFKYSSGKNLFLEINCKYDAEKVTLSFKDNGPGIDKIYHQKIFERFFRVPAKGDTHNIKGSGLGLHYVKQIVENHGGSIKVKSEPGNGTNFIITLPIAS